MNAKNEQKQNEKIKNDAFQHICKNIIVSEIYFELLEEEYIAVVLFLGDWPLIFHKIFQVLSV